MRNGASGKPHIVLIEDNPSDVYLLGLALAESGVTFELTTFQDGAAALLVLCPAVEPADQPLPDLILLDLNTPGPDGFEVLAKIKSTTRLTRVPVAIITSSESPADRNRAQLLGAAKYIQKPTQLNTFIGEVGGAVKMLLAQYPLPSRD